MKDKQDVVIKIIIPDLEQTSMLICKKSEFVSEVISKIHKKWKLLDEPELYGLYRREGTSKLKTNKTLQENKINDNEKLTIKKDDSEEGKFSSVREKSLSNIHNLGIKNKIKYATQRSPKIPKGTNKIFGKHLESIECNSEFGYPTFFEDGLRYLEKNGMETEGLFRQSGENKVIIQYKEKIDKGESVNFEEDFLPHNITGLLKMFLRELEEPIIPFHLYDMFLASNQCAIPESVRWLSFCVSKISPLAYSLLKRFCCFLEKLSHNKDITKMKVENLALVIGPNLMRREHENIIDIAKDTEAVNRIAILLIKYCNDIFVEQNQMQEFYCSICEVLYAYDGIHGMNITPGQVLLCVNDDDPQGEGWWAGEFEGKIEYFAKEYVEVVFHVKNLPAPFVPSVEPENILSAKESRKEIKKQGMPVEKSKSSPSLINVNVNKVRIKSVGHGDALSKKNTNPEPIFSNNNKALNFSNDDIALTKIPSTSLTPGSSQKDLHDVTATINESNNENDDGDGGGGGGGGVADMHIVDSELLTSKILDKRRDRTHTFIKVRQREYEELKNNNEIMEKQIAELTPLVVELKKENKEKDAQIEKLMQAVVKLKATFSKSEEALFNERTDRKKCQKMAYDALTKLSVAKTEMTEVNHQNLMLVKKIEELQNNIS